MDPKNVKGVKNQETPTYVNNAQVFIRFANFYCCFIRAFSNIVRPMINVIKKDKAFR